MSGPPEKESPAPGEETGCGAERWHLESNFNTKCSISSPDIQPDAVRALLRELRQAHRRVDLLRCEIDFAGHALAAGIITPEGAMALLSDIALEMLDLEPRAVEQRRAAA